MTETVVIVGAGEAGGQTAISLRQGGFTAPIVVIGDEAHVPYERPPLSKTYLAGEVGVERMHMRTPEFFTEKDITLRLRETVVHLDRPANSVRQRCSSAMYSACLKKNEVGSVGL